MLLGVSVPSAQAALAGEDDEARRAILDLRQKMEIHREAQSQAIKQALQTSLDQSQKQFEDLRKQFQAVSKQVEADINQSKQENRQALCCCKHKLSHSSKIPQIFKANANSYYAK
jgi:phage-related minor tail protein